MKIANKLFMLTSILLLATSFTPNALSQQDEAYPEYEQEWSWNIPAYAPAKVNINFAYTHNHSITDISCLGTTSLYRHSGGPTNILFEAEDIDTYRYTVDLRYSDIIQQRITVGVWSGSLMVPRDDEYNFYTMHVIVHVTLLVSKEPLYPTAEETAEATLSRLEQQWTNLTQSLENTVRKQEYTMMIMAAASIFSMVVSTISIGMVVTMRKKR